ncbi:hypothetical protein L1987_11046 [Smallanthus sonchifolius]|uniref:Uncharacterized protein n=1 Tax=Smallanthus sonchifolius TaxID=185202 RepID=A0ACB9JDA5_9ASTR|nr:hypothetical protein L1987_11046 [Smallanthus sonchifolius]
MVSADGDGGGNISPLLRTLAKGAVVTLGGILSITMISSTTAQLFTLHKKNQIGSSSSSSSSSSMNKIERVDLGAMTDPIPSPRRRRFYSSVAFKG